MSKLSARRNTRRAGLAALGFIALAVAAQAGAACMDSERLSPRVSATTGPGHVVPAVYLPGAVSATAAKTPSESHEDASIVGLWEFKFAGFAVDWGTQAWHSDGTEITFSGGQNPQTGDVCQGVWRKVGPSTYTLNHIALGWLAPGAGYGLRVHFHMIVKLDESGDAFSGTYTVGVYSVSPADPFDESVQVASGNGTATATRVKPD